MFWIFLYLRKRRPEVETSVASSCNLETQGRKKKLFSSLAAARSPGVVLSDDDLCGSAVNFGGELRGRPSHAVRCDFSTMYVMPNGDVLPCAVHVHARLRGATPSQLF